MPIPVDSVDDKSNALQGIDEVLFASNVDQHANASYSTQNAHKPIDEQSGKKVPIRPKKDQAVDPEKLAKVRLYRCL